MNTFHLTVSSPDGHLFSDDAVKITLRGADGDLAVMAGHIPFVTSIQPCECKIELEDGTVKTGHIESGLLNVSSESVTLLSGSFRW